MFFTFGKKKEQQVTQPTTKHSTYTSTAEIKVFGNPPKPPGFIVSFLRKFIKDI